jgi:hypothetical protein
MNMSTGSNTLQVDQGNYWSKLDGAMPTGEQQQELAALRRRFPSATLENGQLRIRSQQERAAWFQEEIGKDF